MEKPKKLIKVRRFKYDKVLNEMAGFLRLIFWIGIITVILIFGIFLFATSYFLFYLR